MPKKKVARIVVETLEHYGVKRCYGVVGDTLNNYEAEKSSFTQMRGK